MVFVATHDFRHQGSSTMGDCIDIMLAPKSVLILSGVGYQLARIHAQIGSEKSMNVSASRR